MANWRCPHCGTPQPEAARCWVCARSSTTCDTCLHFRAGLLPRTGTCGLDRRGTLLRGDEMRPCWRARGDAGSAGEPGSLFEVTGAPRP
jgi:hypothetical protein